MVTSATLVLPPAKFLQRYCVAPPGVIQYIMQQRSPHPDTLKPFSSHPPACSLRLFLVSISTRVHLTGRTMRQLPKRFRPRGTGSRWSVTTRRTWTHSRMTRRYDRVVLLCILSNGLEQSRLPLFLQCMHTLISDK